MKLSPIIKRCPGPGILIAALAAVLLTFGGVTAEAQSLDVVLSTNLFEPYGVVAATNNNFLISDSAHNRVVRYNPATSVLLEFAGKTGADSAGAIDDAGTLARFFNPQGIVAWNDGFAVADSGNNVIRFVDSDGNVTTLAGDLASAALAHDLELEVDNFGLVNGTGAQVKFHFPTMLAVDSAGDLLISDTLNGVIRKLSAVSKEVTTVATGLARPSGLAVGPDNVIYVADFQRHSIYRIVNGLPVLVAGSDSPFEFGLKDGAVGPRALFNSPHGLLWNADTSEFLVADSGSGAIRRLLRLQDGAVRVSTVEVPGSKTKLASPVALARDRDGAILVADLGDDSIKALRLSTTTVELLNRPLIGEVTFPQFGCGATLNPLTAATFNNDPIIAVSKESSALAFFTYKETTHPEEVEDPDPDNRSSLTPPSYVECQGGFPESLLNVISRTKGPLTFKIIVTRGGRRSAMAVATYVFQCANTSIRGENPAAFTMTNTTRNAVIYYTYGDDPSIADPSPTNSASIAYKNGAVINAFTGKDVWLKARAFRPGYAPSSVVTRQFKAENARINGVGVNRDFKGLPGGLLYVPVEFHPASGSQVRSVQFRVEISPATIGETPSIGEAPLRDNSFIPVTIAPFDAAQGVGYSLGETGHVTNGLGLVFSTGANSQQSVTSTSVVTMLKLRLPPGARHGDKYTIQTLQASGTSDGINTAVNMTNLPSRVIEISTNLNYVVGDTAAAEWYNAGEFGDRDLNNDDVNSVFLATLGYRRPYEGSDAFDAMDAFPLDTVERPGGDGQLRYLDYQIILLRSLRLDPVNWTRTRDSAGQRVASGGSLRVGLRAQAVPSPGNDTIIWQRPVLLGGRTVDNALQSVPVSVPVFISIRPGSSLSGLQFVARFSPSAGSVDLPPILFVPAAGRPAPNKTGSWEPNSLSCSWNLGSFAPGLMGETLLGNLQFNVPATARRGDFYTLNFAAADGSPDANTQYDFETLQTRVWVDMPAPQPDSALPVEWVARFLDQNGIIARGDQDDPDGDGAPNLLEYQAGTDPSKNNLQLRVTSLTTGEVEVSWFGHSGLSYLVEASGSLTGAWEPLGAARSGGGTVDHLLQPAAGTAPRFYRIRVLSNH